MLKTRRETETHEVVVIDDVICNKCGKSIRYVPNNMGASIFALEYVTVDHSWGYNSNKDMSTQQVHICEPCWDSFCATLAVPPTEGFDGGGEDPPASQLYLFSQVELSGDPEIMSGVCNSTRP